MAVEKAPFIDFNDPYMLVGGAALLLAIGSALAYFGPRLFKHFTVADFDEAQTDIQQSVARRRQ